MNSTVSEIEKNFSHLKSEAGKENSQISLRVSSHNDGMRIWELANSQGIEAAIFNSLNLEFIFVKSDLILKFIETALGQIGVNQFNSVVKSFYRLNVELNMASAAELSQYPQIKLSPAPKQAQKNDFVEFLMSSGLEKVHFM